MSANKKPEGPFTFGIMELSRFLDKSPATIRKWEENGLFVFPRNSNGERTFTSDDVRDIVLKANELNRISIHRQFIVEALMTLIEQIEYENRKANKK